MNVTHKHLSMVVAASLGVALAACSSDNAVDDPSTNGNTDTTAYAEDALHVIFSPMYSAFGGEHTYQLPVTIDQAALDANGTDPVKVETINWSVDSKMVQTEPFSEIEGGVLLTTKAAGVTQIVATAETKSGRKIKGTSTLEITSATDAEWQLGQARYDNGVQIDFGTAMPPMGGADGAPPDPMEVLNQIPKDASCGNCHNNAMGLTVEHTPLQTGGYSDEDLIKIFTMGAKPMGAKFNSPFLKNLPVDVATTIYESLHMWSIPAEAQQGIVLKLRSITPKVQPDIDLMRLRMMPPTSASGAAGS